MLVIFEFMLWCLNCTINKQINFVVFPFPHPRQQLECTASPTFLTHMWHCCCLIYADKLVSLFIIINWAEIEVRLRRVLTWTFQRTLHDFHVDILGSFPGVPLPTLATFSSRIIPQGFDERFPSAWSCKSCVSLSDALSLMTMLVNYGSCSVHISPMGMLWFSFATGNALIIPMV